MTIDLLTGAAALHRIGAGGVRLLTEAATASTFLRDDLAPHERADVRRVVDISTGCCEAAAQNEHQHFVAAFVDGRFGGYVISTRHGPGDHELDWLMVHPDCHGTAVSAVLMEAGMVWLGLDRPMWLNVLRHNQRAQRFYRRFGFDIDPAATTGHVMPHWVMRRPPGPLAHGAAPDTAAPPAPG